MRSRKIFISWLQKVLLSRPSSYYVKSHRSIGFARIHFDSVSHYRIFRARSDVRFQSQRWGGNCVTKVRRKFINLVQFEKTGHRRCFSKSLMIKRTNLLEVSSMYSRLREDICGTECKDQKLVDHCQQCLKIFTKHFGLLGRMVY